MLRCDYKLNTACNRVSIEANTCIQFEKSDDESIPIGTPVLWDEALMLKIDIDKYRIYHICCIFVPNGMYSIYNWNWREKRAASLFLTGCTVE